MDAEFEPEKYVPVEFEPVRYEEEDNPIGKAYPVPGTRYRTGTGFSAPRLERCYR